MSYVIYRSLAVGSAFWLKSLPMEEKPITKIKKTRGCIQGVKMSLEYPNRPVAAGSSFYIKRPPIEDMGMAQIKKPGGFLRIQGTQKMGKSSLLNQLSDYATSEGYKTVFIDLQQADEKVFRDLDTFLRWFCINVTHVLKVPCTIKDYWDEEIGSKTNCTLYFEEYLLNQFDTPIVLAINEVNRLFDYPKIAQDFLPMLRYWYEKAQQTVTFLKLRLVLAYSTEIYIKLSIHQSPFNIGLPLKLSEFTGEQILELAHIYGVRWTNYYEIEQIIAMVGGHPYLINLALYHLTQQTMTLEKLLSTAPTQAGIYSEHLRSIWLKLQECPEVLNAFEQVLLGYETVQLDPHIAYKLDSLGIVNLVNNVATIKCELYRLYFMLQNSPNKNLSLFFG